QQQQRIISVSMSTASNDSKRTRLTTFDAAWIVSLEAEKWLTKGKVNTDAFCLFCDRPIHVGSGGISAIKQHMKAKIHEANAATALQQKQKSIASFCTKQKDPAASSSDDKSIKTTAAEIRWVWNSAYKSKSFNTEDDSPDLFRAMFSDSKIAASFSCARTKQAYLLSFAIVPFVQQKITESIVGVDALESSFGFYSISYDESDGLMMICVRYLNSEGSVVVEMLNQLPLEGHDAASCAQLIRQCVLDSKLPLSKWIGNFSDGCSVMVGEHAGVSAILRQTPELEHLLDIGSCTLHIVANAFRKASDCHLSEVSDLADDIFACFSRSITRRKEFKALQEQIGMAQLSFKRNVELRWLILLPCLERIEEQWVPLSLFLSQSDDNSDRMRRLRAAIQNPDTLVCVRFMIHALKLASRFEKLLQESCTVLIHRLHPEMTALLEAIAIQFIQPSAFEKKSVAFVNFKDQSLHLPMTKIVIGQQATLPDRQKPLLFRFKQFYLAVATYLQEKLPLKKKVLRCMKFLDFTTEVDEEAVLFVAKKLPLVVPASDISSLQTEVRLLNLRTNAGDLLLPDNHDIAGGWRKAAKTGRYPLLSRLASACCTLFHGNADAERFIGKSHDASANPKRNRLSDEKLRDSLLARSFLCARSLKPKNVPIPDELIQAALKASSEYKQRMAAEKKASELAAIKKAAEAEQEKLRREAEKNAERKDALERLAQEQSQQVAKKAETTAKCIEAERDVQIAIDRLRKAQGEDTAVSVRLSQFESERLVIEQRAMDQVVQRTAEEAARLKRQAENAALARLPHVPKKKKN
ncbi:hypothetical protein BOX15_Mlig023025g5, partial [Macrostomum lignano]